MASRTVFLTLYFWFLAFIAAAEPANVLVGDLTFTRPEGWKWEEPSGKSSAITRFILPDESRGKVDIRFYVEAMDADHSDEAWVKHFTDFDPAKDVQLVRKKVRGRQVQYLTLRGTYLTPNLKVKRHPKHLLITATIPFEGKAIRVRIIGHESVVKPAAAEFRKMVESAVMDSSE